MKRCVHKLLWTIYVRTVIQSYPNPATQSSTHWPNPQSIHHHWQGPPNTGQQVFAAEYSLQRTGKFSKKIDEQCKELISIEHSERRTARTPNSQNTKNFEKFRTVGLWWARSLVSITNMYLNCIQYCKCVYMTETRLTN